jgi:hypothetical protein
MRRRVLAIPVGIIICLMGSVWFLQGVGVLPGSFMTGSGFWAVAGGIAVIVGLALIGIGALPAKRVDQGKQAASY